MDKYRIDSHKLLYHPHQVSQWMEGKNIFPIYMEVSPTSACNHRCVFCALDFVGYKKDHIETQRLKDIISELGDLGLKSIMYAGEGEPFLHRDLAEIIIHTKASGIDVGIATNGVMMDSTVFEKIVGATEWIKISCNAGSAETYSKIHRTNSTDFDKVINNLKHAVRIKNSGGHACTLGVQIILLPENEHEIERLAFVSRDMGLDYLVVKPYSQHPKSLTIRYKDINYRRYGNLAKDLEKLNTSHFDLIFRKNTMKRWDNREKSYKRCLALPFWSYMDSLGNIWGCSVYLKDDRFFYGNIYEQSFQEIWTGEKRRSSLTFVENDLDPAICRLNCRMDDINRYLWELKHPPLHVNFI